VEAGATASRLSPTLLRLTGVLVAMLMTAALWWLYFDTHAGRTFERLRAADDRGRLGRDLSYLYILLVAGIIVAAVANELVIAHPSRHLHGAALAALAAGPVLYLLGSVVLKVRVLRVPWERRCIAASLVAVAVAVGSPLPGLALWAVVLAVLTGLATVEAVETRQEATAPARPSESAVVAEP
jgi:low temperature requirement protein LtrA